jgi:hypothetical protein
MSELRPLPNAKPGTYVPNRADSFYMIRDAVRSKVGLIHGQLHKDGESCAIGAFFDCNPKVGLPSDLTDEVAAYNDSIGPRVTAQQRRRKVLAWLNFKLKCLVGGVV